MNIRHSNTILQHIRQLAAADELKGLSDVALLQRFVALREEEAFAVLMQRHGPLVWHVCRHVLSHDQDAEEAFQATFLVLVAKARSIRNQRALPGWLHGTAYRVALRAKRDLAIRRIHERRGQTMGQSKSLPETVLREALALLDEEVARLPERQRAVFVLCSLEGRSLAEAALELGWKKGTVSGTLARARQQLRRRLTKRGITLSSILTAAALDTQTSSAVLPTSLAKGTVRAVLCSLAGRTAGVSTAAAEIARSFLKGLALARTATVLTAIVAMSLAAAATGYFAMRSPAAPAAQEVDNAPDRSERPGGVAEAGPPAAKVDQFGDTLPAGAIARIGTVRWWYGQNQQGCSLSYLADGKSLVFCQSGKGLRMLDTTTGKELRRIEDNRITCFALSPDGKFLVTASSESPAVRVWEASSGRLLRQLPGVTGGTDAVAFSRDGKQLAAATGQQCAQVWDVATWTETARLPTGWLHSLGFLPDGKSLVTVGEDIRWWDIISGHQVRRLNFKIEPSYNFVLSPDGKRLAAMVRPGELHVWAAMSGAELFRKAMAPEPERGVWDLCFSPDSNTLVCSGGIGGRGPGQTLFLEAGTGREMLRWNEASDAMTFSSDGRFLAQSVRRRLQIRDAKTGNAVLQTPEIPSCVVSLAFAPDGKALHAGCWGGAIASWDPMTGQRLTPFHRVPEGFAGTANMLLGTAISADGKKAALVDVNGALHVWEWTTGKRLCRIDSPRVDENQATFSPDGKLIAIKHTDDVIRLWDVATGVLHCSLQKFGNRQLPHPHVFSPDGRILATAPGSMDKPIRLWDTLTGKLVGELAWQDNTNSRCTCLAHSPDGKSLIAGHMRPLFPGIGETSPAEDSLSLWDLASRRELRRFPVPSNDIRAVSISPDNKTLAAAANHTVLLWELASGKERGRFLGHGAWVFSLAFSPDGRLLASGGLDYTALIWDGTGVSPDGKWSLQDLSPKEMEHLWADLAGSDGVQAYRAIWRMAGARQSVPFLAKRLQSVPAVEETRILQLIANLDSDRFDLRDQASNKLQEIGECAESDLRQALANNPSPEARRRLEKLVEHVTSKALTVRQLRDLRALEILEHNGTPEAAEIMVKLAKGAPMARLTIESKACLDRMGCRLSGPR